MEELKCDSCSTIFSYRHNLVRHLNSGTCLNSHIKCAIQDCEARFTRNDALNLHLHNIHSIKLETVKHHFSSSEEFVKWKAHVESNKHCKYVKKRGLRRLSNGTQRKQVFYCHRDGSFEENPNRQKLLKSQGSNKIGASCPSQIHYLEMENGEVDITFTSTHIGHDENNIGHLPLSCDERRAIAGKIKSGVPYDFILDEIRDSVSDVYSSVALVTKQDLRNIVRDHDLDPSRSHSDDTTSVDVWVSKVKTLNEPTLNPVIFYKRQGESSNIEGLADEDILLVLANSFQINMLAQFGNNIICMDSTHGTNQYDFHLTTLVVVDEYGSGIPTAFCFSNKKDCQTWRIFFSKLRELSSIGVLKSKVFMSDDDESFYNAWKDVMCPVEHRLLCTWHIDRAWRQNLQTRISNKEKRILVYKGLRVLLQESKVSTFTTLLSGFLQQLNSDSETKLFGAYFNTYYVPRQTSWAYCYRKGCGINTNMRLEAAHKVIKYFYLYGKKNKRLDKAIDALTKYTRDCLFKRLRKKSKNARTSQLDDIVKGHLKAGEVTIRCSDKLNVWIAQSSTQSPIYEVELINEIKICNEECLVICEKCELRICIHTFSCECLQYLIRNTICKHIHSCVAFIARNKPQSLDGASMSEDYNHNAVVAGGSQEVTVGATTPVTEHENKCDAIDSLTPFLINPVSPDENMEVRSKVEVLLGYLTPEFHYSNEARGLLTRKIDQLLDIVRTNHFSKPPAASEPANKNVCKQRRFFSTKKKRISNSNSLSKPTPTETASLIESMENPEMPVENVHVEFDHMYTHM